MMVSQKQSIVIFMIFYSAIFSLGLIAVSIYSLKSNVNLIQIYYDILTFFIRVYVRSAFENGRTNKLYVTLRRHHHTWNSLKPVDTACKRIIQDVHKFSLTPKPPIAPPPLPPLTP